VSLSIPSHSPFDLDHLPPVGGEGLCVCTVLLSLYTLNAFPSSFFVESWLRTLWLSLPGSAYDRRRLVIPGSSRGPHRNWPCWPRALAEVGLTQVDIVGTA
jgi:hypothetical protein